MSSSSDEEKKAARREYLKKWHAANPGKRAAYLKKWRETHPEKAAEQTRKWRAANPDKVREIWRRAAKTDKGKARAQKYRARNQDKFRRWMRAASRRAAGMIFAPGQTEESMLIDQGGFCAICKSDMPDSRKRHVDHCHTTGHVRAILCDNCNLGLGRFRDDPALLRAAAIFAETHAARIASIPTPEQNSC